MCENMLQGQKSQLRITPDHASRGTFTETLVENQNAHECSNQIATFDNSYSRALMSTGKPEEFFFILFQGRSALLEL
jgi:hypothetical protein